MPFYSKHFLLILGFFFTHLALNSPTLANQNYDFDQIMSLNPSQRLSLDTGLYCSQADDKMEFLSTYNGWDIENHRRIRHKEIEEKLLQNVREAKNFILASFFLFDNMYSEGSPQSRITQRLTDLLIQKKRLNPSIKIAVILDPLNRAYSRRVARSLELFYENGIDVFFSDLSTTNSATKIGAIEFFKEAGSVLSGLTGGLLGSATNEVASLINFCVPGSTDKCLKKLDGHPADLEMIFEAMLLKANHKKVLVTDHERNEWRALVSSANPHNASDDSTNTAIMVSGDIAKHIYVNLREDLGHSLKREASMPFHVGIKNSSRKFAWLSRRTQQRYPGMLRMFGQGKMEKYLHQAFPPINLQNLNKNKSNRGTQFCSRYVTEKKIKDHILRLLKNAKADDEIRIQMFYLSDPEVVQAILEAANRPGRKQKIRLLLDPSKDAFNSIKDGTPNRQTANWLLQNSQNIAIHWYATHGEQNHAKVMSINGSDGINYLLTGSTNWTGKNLNDINMEANLLVYGGNSVTSKFNSLFDKFWFNTDPGVLYSWNFNAYNYIASAYLNLGYDAIRELSSERIQQIARANQDFVKDHFLMLESLSGRQAHFIKSKSPRQINQWVMSKIENDPHTTLRAVSYFVGEPLFEGLSPRDQQKWYQNYTKKWRNGERFGYVTW